MEITEYYHLMTNITITGLVHIVFFTTFWDKDGKRLALQLQWHFPVT